MNLAALLQRCAFNIPNDGQQSTVVSLQFDLSREGEREGGREGVSKRGREGRE